VSEPYLSIVVTARNDDHGGNLLKRMQIFITAWLEQSRLFGIPSELIIVEWNPPAGRPPLIEALRWPEKFGSCVVRIIEVPLELHRRLAHADSLPLYQMIAKNVGIRRARGTFVLATNIDILFSDELASFLSRQVLDAKRMYRIDRFDVMSDVPLNAPLEVQLNYCRTHLIRINRREGTFPTAADGSPDRTRSDVAAADSGILFGPGWFPLEWSASEQFRWAEKHAQIMLGQQTTQSLVLLLDLEPGPATGGLPLDLEISVDDRLLGRVRIDHRSELRVPLNVPLAARLALRHVGPTVIVAEDPRTLCLRLFRIRYEMSHRDGSAGAGPPSVRAIRRFAWLKSRWAALQYVITKLAKEGPLVKLTVPVSPRFGRWLKVYVDACGLTGLARRDFRAPSIGSSRNTSPIEPKPAEFLHTNGCGDFTLVSRDRWFDLRGYPEFDMFSMNLDSLFCFNAHYGGAREEVLQEPMRIYHIEHATGSGWTPEGQSTLFERLAAKGLGFISNEDVLAWAAQMARLQTPMIFNHEDWGFGDVSLQETILPRKQPD
jgi:hypothetical protein